MTRTDLLSHKWMEFFRLWSCHMSLTIADVEFAHARNRKRATRSANRNTSWSNFSADYVCEEVGLVFASRVAERALLKTHHAPSTLADADEATPSVPRPTETSTDMALALPARQPVCTQNTKAWRPIDLLRDDLMRSRSHKVNWFSKAGWAFVREQWEGLSAGRKFHHESLSEHSQGSARVHRRAKSSKPTSSLHALPATADGRVPDAIVLADPRGDFAPLAGPPDVNTLCVGHSSLSALDLAMQSMMII